MEIIDCKSQEQVRAVLAMLQERQRQDVTFGRQDQDPAYWATILGEQFGQVCEAVAQLRWGPDNADNFKSLTKQLEQVGAVAMNALECLYRGTQADDITTARPSDRRQLYRALGRDDEALHYDMDQS